MTKLYFLVLLLFVFSFIIPNLSYGESCGVTDEPIDLKYAITDETVGTICYDKESRALLIPIDSMSAGSINVEIPRELIDPRTKDCKDDKVLVIVNGNEVNYRETETTNHYRIISISFPMGKSEIEILEHDFIMSPYYTGKNCVIPSAEQGWNNYWIKGKYYLPNYELVFQVFKISYRITGGEVEKIELPHTGSDLVTTIKTYQDGIFEIKIPRNLPMTNTGNEISPFIIIDGKEIKHQEEKEKCLIKVSVPFQNGSRLIEILGTVNLGSDPVHSIEVPPECIIKPSPKDQIEYGILPEEIICSDNRVLVKKLSKDTVACVKPSTAEKLVQRGWGIIPDAS